MLSILKKIWRIFTPKEQKQTLAMLIMACLMALVETIGVVSIMPFLSVLGRPEIANENAILLGVKNALNLQNNNKFLLALGLFSIAAVVSSAIFKTITLHKINRYTHMLRHSLSSRLLSRYLEQPYEFFLKRNPTELSKNVLSEADQFTFNLLQPLALLIAHGVVVISMVVLIIAYDPWMAVGIVTTVGLLYCTIYLIVRHRLKVIGKFKQLADVGRYQTCSEILGGIKDVKVTHTANAWLENYRRHSYELSRHTATAETITASPLYLVEATGYSGLIFIALLLLWRSNDIAHVLPALGMYGFAAYRLLPAAQVMYRGFARLQYSNASLEIIHKDLALPPAIDHSNNSKIERKIIPQREIQLNSVSYSYPGTPNKLVLDELSLTIPVNTSVGISGASGTGKSTLMDILLGLLEPQRGTLSVDGMNISTEMRSAWQRSIGYVSQHIYLSDASVAENIAFGVSKAEIDMSAVERAARAAQIHHFVSTELPEGYATKVGDRGIRLSGGQRQRVGIARALYEDPSILLMDEATSALDLETEAAVTESIRELSGKKTIIVIAHREISLQACDKVIQLHAPRKHNPSSQFQ